MSLPLDLKDYALFVEGDYLGETNMTRLPKLAYKVEEWIGSGMSGPIEIDQHLEKMDCEWETRGFSLDAYEQFGVRELGGLGLSFRGAYQRGNDGDVTTVEWLVRGQHRELEGGENKRGENGTTKVVTSIVTVTLLVNDQEKIHVDMLAGVERYNGVDKRSGLRDALGI